MVHQLKIENKYFEDVIKGVKTFEIRKNDRDFRVGDILGLNELDKDGIKETGRSTLAEIVYIMPEYSGFTAKGYDILGIAPYPQICKFSGGITDNSGNCSRKENGFLIQGKDKNAK